jgi:hypothetical protein
MRWKDQPGEMEFTIEVSYKSTGYYDSGTFFDPPEGECDARMESMTIDGKPIPDELAKAIWAHIGEQVDQHAYENAENAENDEPLDRN